MLPKITIITPTLNQDKYLERTILSVLNQHYPYLEYLVFDGGSSDKTLEILDKYRPQIQYSSEFDRGQSHAINKGLAKARGEIVAFLNSDDEYEPHTLFTIGNYFSHHPEVVWACGKCRIINEKGIITHPMITNYKNILLRLKSPLILQIVNFISQPAVFWRREVIAEVGYFDEELHEVMDYDYWLRLIQKYPYAYIDKYLARFRIYSTSKTIKSAFSESTEENIIINRYIHSKILFYAHRLHRKLAIKSYKFLFNT